VSLPVELLDHLVQLLGLQGSAVVLVVLGEDVVAEFEQLLHLLLAECASDVVDAQLLAYHGLCVLGLVVELVLLVLLGDVVGRLVFEGLSLLQSLEVFGCILDDVGRLVSQDFSGEVLEDERESFGDGIFLNVSAGHQLYYYGRE